MIVFFAGLCCGLGGVSAFFIWARDYLKHGQNSARSLDETYILATALTRTSVVFIIVWLLMRNTGFRIGYLFSLPMLIGGIYFGYRADIEEKETESGDSVFKKIILLVFGFLALVITGL